MSFFINFFLCHMHQLSFKVKFAFLDEFYFYDYYDMVIMDDIGSNIAVSQDTKSNFQDLIYYMIIIFCFYVP